MKLEKLQRIIHLLVANNINLNSADLLASDDVLMLAMPQPPRHVHDRLLELGFYLEPEGIYIYAPKR